MVLVRLYLLWPYRKSKTLGHLMLAPCPRVLNYRLFFRVSEEEVRQRSLLFFVQNFEMSKTHIVVNIYKYSDLWQIAHSDKYLFLITSANIEKIMWCIAHFLKKKEIVFQWVAALQESYSGPLNCINHFFLRFRTDYLNPKWPAILFKIIRFFFSRKLFS